MPQATLLLRLEGPVQAWGQPGMHWETRHSLPRPTKSGVLGLVANALGRTYESTNEDLAALRFGVRSDRPGHMERDFQSAGGGAFPTAIHTALSPDSDRVRYAPPQAAGPGGTVKKFVWDEHPVLKDVTFIVDSGFLVSLTGEETLLRRIQDALHHPHRLLFLGRKALLPHYPLAHQLLTGDQHATWADTVPLLPTATTQTPTTWLEVPHDEGGQTFPEQPFPGRHHAPLALARKQTAPPPAPTDDEVAA